MNISIRDSVTYVKEKHRLSTARDIIKHISTQYLQKLGRSKTRAFDLLQFPNSNFRFNRRTGSILLPGLCKTTFLCNSFLFTSIKSFNLVIQKPTP